MTARDSRALDHFPALVATSKPSVSLCLSGCLAGLGGGKGSGRVRSEGKRRNPSAGTDQFFEARDRVYSHVGVHVVRCCVISKLCPLREGSAQRVKRTERRRRLQGRTQPARRVMLCSNAKAKHSTIHARNGLGRRSQCPKQSPHDCAPARTSVQGSEARA